ncbi:MAG: chromosome segregation protein SMC [Clostridiales bacterium]|nr:chromosome segregation protein SMC [Clostridiales bacterium]
MKLKKLLIQGFKSFADKTEIVLNEGITGIVGPNGSGKSNIGDAVRWVLGEQSARVLRGTKMEDIIFNGTAKRKAAHYCEVTLIFDNEDGALKSSYSEVSVTRRVYRNGDSEYYLNQTACRLRDILELFRDTGIGREGYSLIGQGRIDEILSVKSEDRRQIFEEAAGVMTFRVRKEEAERKLNKTTDNLSRVNDILEELGSRIEPLCQQAETAREYLELADKLKILEVNIFLVRHDKLKERIAGLQEVIDGLSDVLHNHEAVINETNEKRQELDAAIAALEEQLALERAAHLEKNDAYYRAKAAAEKTEQQIETEKTQITDLRKEIEAQTALRAETAALFEKGEEDTEKGKAALEAAQKDSDLWQSRLDAAQEEAEKKEQELDDHKSSILAFVNRVSEVRNKQTRSQTMCAQMQERLEQINGSMSQMEEKKTELELNLDNAKSNEQHEDQLLSELRSDYAKTEGNLRLLSEDVQKKSDSIQQKNIQLQGDKSRLRLLEDMNREMEGYNSSVKNALQYAGNDPAVYDVLARLIHVPKELETAIDMVLGGTLQNIVTRDEETAKGIIDYLKANKLGRVTFLPMSSVRSRLLTPDEKKLLSMPGCLGVASDLIEYDEKFRGIVENLLGRTVVSTNLDCGIPLMRAGHHAFRLVTLDGQVMHSGGSMTGGTPQSKTVSLLGRERQMKELQETVKNTENNINILRKDLEKLIADRNECQRLRSEAIESVHQQEIAVAREQERVFNAEAELNAHIQRIEQSKLAQEQLKESIEDLTRDMKAADDAAQSVTTDREALDEKTVVLQDALKAARQKVEDMRAQVQKAQMHYSELSHALDTLRRDKQRRDEELAAYDTRISSLNKTVEDKENALIELQTLLETCRLEETDIQASVQEKADIISKLETERAQKTAAQRECVEKSENAHKQYDEDSLKLHKTELSLSKAESDLKQITDHIFNEYELTYATSEELRIQEGFSLGESEKTAASYRSRIRELGPINVNAIEEYANTKQRFDEMTTQKDDLIRAQEDLHNLIVRLLSQMEKQFVSEFDKLNDFFGVTFARLFGGGQAELRLSDPHDALNCGIEIIAQPPGKKLQLLSLLSGGERALTAIAILFAMLKLKPTPFCILDEIEAALDEANIGYFADYLSEYASDTQFVVVTHRKGTMERCNSLFGVAMQEKGISKMVSVDLKDYE